MSRTTSIKTLLLALTLAAGVPAAAGPQATTGETTAGEAAAGHPLDAAADDAQRKLERSLAELSALREQLAAEKIPLTNRLNELEKELTRVRDEFQQTSRLLDTRTLGLSNLRNEIKTREEEATYLSSLLDQFVRNLESRLHITELHRYEDALEAARLAPENSNLSATEIYAAQTKALSLSLDRAEEALGGVRFEGTAVDKEGRLRPGTFVLVGPAAIFRSADGRDVGTAQQRLGSLEPSVVSFNTPEDAVAAAQIVTFGQGMLPFDPTLGNAHKIEATEETFVQHVQKGGPVMVPIFVLAGAAFLVALYKWIGFLFVRRPARSRIDALLRAVTRRDQRAAMEKARAVGGPTGRMLAAGVEHLNEPRELIEEIMYETVLTTRLKLQRLLPFIAISAAAAPLLGLLGTVTGIINTFKLITVFGSGDVKTLSGGISEALITTEFGLIVAIPSLLLHAFLSRKARGVVDQMEKSAIAFVNAVSKSRSTGRSPAIIEDVQGTAALPPPPPPIASAPAEAAHAATPTEEQVRDALTDLLVPMIRDRTKSAPPASGETDAPERQRETIET